MRRRIACLIITLGVVIALVLLIVILALTVFKPKNPITSVDSINFRDMDMDYNIFALSVDTNVTLAVDVTVKNPNNFGFKYSDTTALLNYRGQLVGEAPVPSQEIHPGETKAMNLTLNVMANRLMSNPQLYNDLSTGALPLNTFFSVSAEVKILGFIKVHVDASTTCDFKINLTNETLWDKRCQSKTKL